MFVTYLASLMISVVCAWIISTLNVKVRKPVDINYFDERYWFSSYPEKAFSVQPPYRIDPQSFLFWSAVGLVLPLLWIMINVPEMQNVAITYVLLMAVFMSPALLEYVMPEKMSVTGMVAWGGYNYLIQAMVGVGIAAVCIFIALSTPKLQFLPESVEALGITIVSFYISVVAVPIVEEFTFGNLVSCSLIKKLGLILGTIASAFTFSIFHYLVYAPVNPLILIVPFVFRVLASIALVRFVSFLPGYVGHVVVNFVAWVGGR